MRWLSLLFLTARAVAAPTPYEAFVTNYPPVYTIAGFEFLSRLEVFRPFDDEKKAFSFSRPDGNYRVAWDARESRVILSRDHTIWIEIPLAPLVARAESYLTTHPGVAGRAMPQEALTWEQENERVRVRLYFDDLSLRREKEQLLVYHFKADLLAAPKKSSDTVSKR